MSEGTRRSGVSIGTLVFAIIMSLAFGVFAGFFVGRPGVLIPGSVAVSSVVVVSREPPIAGADQPTGAGKYTVVVTREGWGWPAPIRAVVYTYADGQQFHDLGTLGSATSYADAATRFGVVRWAPEGVYIGSGSPNDTFLDRATMQSHR